MNRSGCNWSNSLTNMKLWEYLDDMDIVEKTPQSRASSRSRDRVAFHVTRSSVACLLALILILLSVTLYLDRTLEPAVGWQLHTKQYQRQGSAQTKLAAARAAEVGEDLQDSSLGSKPRLSDGALLGMGITFRKGSRAMSELVVAHLQDTTTPTEFRLFLRTLHRSGVTGRADVVFLFPSGGPVHDNNQLKRILTEEEGSFWRIMLAQLAPAPTHHHTRKNSKKPSKRSSNNSALVGKTNHTSDSMFVMPNSSITEFNMAGPPLRRLNASQRKKRHFKRSDRTKSSPFNTTYGMLKAAAVDGDRMDFKMWNHTNSGPSEILDSKLNETAARRDSKRLSTDINPGSSETIDSNAFKMSKVPICPFNFLAFWKSREEGIQGKGRQLRDRIMWKADKQDVHGSGSTDDDMTAAVKWGDWGSIAGFEMQDLEQDEAIAGFIDNPPSQLRRWMCYKMLLGMVKRQYQNVLLTEVSEVFIMGDIMAPTRDPSFGSSVYLFSEDRTWNQSYEASRSRSRALLRERYEPMGTNDQKAVESLTEPSQNGSEGNGSQQLASILDVYGKEVWKKLEEEDKQRSVLSSGIIMGNMKSIQALSNAMLTEIVRVAILRKSREPFHDQPLLNYMVQKSGILNRKVSQKLSVLSSGASSVHTLPGSTQKFLFVREEGAMFDALQGLHHELVLEETRKAVIESIHADICSSQGGLRVYEDCPPVPKI